jgi:hypothetical protein
VIESMNALYDAYVAAPESKTGKLPVVKCVGVHPITGKHGTNYQPQLEIVGWADRPTELAGAPAVSTPTPTPAPADVPAQHVGPPAVATPAPAGDVDDVEF